MPLPYPTRQRLVSARCRNKPVRCNIKNREVSDYGKQVYQIGRSSPKSLGR